MPLPAPQTRKHLHTRSVTFCGYQREDGLWDIEAEMSDVKTYVMEAPGRRALQPGIPVHDMAIRVTVDDSMTIHEIVTTMDSTPFSECPHAQKPMQQMIGCKIGPGWRHTIEKNLGGIKGCTHLRELLFNVATAAYQTMPSYRDQQQKTTGMLAPSTSQPPWHLGKCLAWDFNGPVVKRLEPKFFGSKPLKTVDKME